MVDDAARENMYYQFGYHRYSDAQSCPFRPGEVIQADEQAATVQIEVVMSDPPNSVKPGVIRLHKNPEGWRIIDIVQTPKAAADVQP